MRRRALPLIAALLAAGALLWPTTARADGGCSGWNIAERFDCGIAVTQLQTEVAINQLLWSGNQLGLMLARTVEGWRTDLIVMLRNIFDVLVPVVQFPFYLAAAVALIVFSISYFLQVIVDARWVDLRRGILHFALALALFSYGSQGMAALEELRLALGQAIAATVRVGVANAGQGVGGAEGASFSFYGDNVGDIPAMMPIYGSGAACDTERPDLDAMYLSDYASRYLWAEASDIHCPSFAEGDGRPRVPLGFQARYINVYGDDFAEADTTARASYIAQGWDGVARQLLAIPMVIGAVLEQVTHLLFAVALAFVWFGLLLSVVFSLFLPSEAMFRGQLRQFLTILVASGKASLFLGLLLALLRAAGATGNGVVVAAVGTLGLAIVAWQLVAAKMTAVETLMSVGAVTGGAPQALGSALGGAARAVATVAGAAAGGVLTLGALGAAAAANPGGLGQGVKGMGKQALTQFRRDLTHRHQGGLLRRTALGALADGIEDRYDERQHAADVRAAERADLEQRAWYERQWAARSRPRALTNAEQRERQAAQQILTAAEQGADVPAAQVQAARQTMRRLHALTTGQPTAQPAAETPEATTERRGARVAALDQQVIRRQLGEVERRASRARQRRQWAQADQLDAEAERYRQMLRMHGETSAAERQIRTVAAAEAARAARPSPRRAGPTREPDDTDLASENARSARVRRGPPTPAQARRMAAAGARRDQQDLRARDAAIRDAYVRGAQGAAATLEADEQADLDGARLALARLDQQIAQARGTDPATAARLDAVAMRLRQRMATITAAQAARQAETLPPAPTAATTAPPDPTAPRATHASSPAAPEAPAGSAATPRAPQAPAPAGATARPAAPSVTPPLSAVAPAAPHRAQPAPATPPASTPAAPAASAAPAAAATAGPVLGAQTATVDLGRDASGGLLVNGQPPRSSQMVQGGVGMTLADGRQVVVRGEDLRVAVALEPGQQRAVPVVTSPAPPAAPGAPAHIPAAGAPVVTSPHASAVASTMPAAPPAQTTPPAPAHVPAGTPPAASARSQASRPVLSRPTPSSGARPAVSPDTPAPTPHHRPRPRPVVRRGSPRKERG